MQWLGGLQVWYILYQDVHILPCAFKKTENNENLSFSNDKQY